MQRVGDGRCHARGNRHGQETGVDAVAFRQAETHIRRAAGGVDLELGAQAVHQLHHLHTGPVDGADRHHQRVDHDVAGGNTVVGGTFDNLLGHRETHVRVLRNAGFVVGDRHHGGAVFLDQRQYRLQPIFLARDRVDQRFALVDRQARFQRSHDGGVDRQRHVGHALHQLDRLGQHARLIGQRNAGIHVQHVGARGHLGQRIGNHAAVVVGQHFGRHDLAPGRVDAFADDDERPVEADHDLPGGGADDGVCHVVSLIT